MKKRQLLTTAAALIMSVGVVSCASDKEKMEKQEQERQEEIRDAEKEQQKMEEEHSAERQEMEEEQQEEGIFGFGSDSETASAEQSDKPWADQQIALDKVEKVQEKLKNEGYNVGSVDGLIGPNTESALREFQESNDLSASGELNQETIDALGVDVELDDQQFAE